MYHTIAFPNLNPSCIPKQQHHAPSLVILQCTRRPVSLRTTTETRYTSPLFPPSHIMALHTPTHRTNHHQPPPRNTRSFYQAPFRCTAPSHPTPNTCHALSQSPATPSLQKRYPHSLPTQSLSPHTCLTTAGVWQPPQPPTPHRVSPNTCHALPTPCKVSQHACHTLSCLHLVRLRSAEESAGGWGTRRGG